MAPNAHSVRTSPDTPSITSGILGILKYACYCSLVTPPDGDVIYGRAPKVARLPRFRAELLVLQIFYCLVVVTWYVHCP